MLNFPSFFNAQAGGYEIEQSVKFDSARQSYLNRTPASAGNRKTWTWSGWVKYTVNNASAYNQPLFWASSVATTGISFSQNPNTAHHIYVYNAGQQIETTQFFRDPSAWYHIVAVIDTTQATASNRTKLYINGVQVTDLTTALYPSQNADGDINNTVEHNIGKQVGQSRYLDAYLAEVNFIDGSALDPTDFGEFDESGVWRPIKYTGSYTGNSFYLEFVQGDLGTDSSGLGNNWTTNELWEEIGTPDYAGNWIGSTSGSFYSGSWENVFNGDVTVYSNYIYAYNNTATLTFSTPLTGVIEVYGSDGGNTGANSGYISLSDGSTWSINNVARANAQWHSFGSKSNITTITVSSPGGHGAILGAIRVDGNLLANISAKANYVNMADTPTTNWCTLNPNDSFLQTISNGNLVSSNTNNVTTPGVRATMAMPSGKWYWEITCGVFTSASTWMIGVADTYERIAIANYTSAGSYLYYSGNGQKYNASSSSAYGATYTTGDVIGVAYDADNGKIWFAKNNTWQNSGDPAAGTGEAYSGITGLKSPYVGTGLYQVESLWNFGQRDFEYTPPTGFSALSTSNLPAPDIADGSQHFDTKLYTANNSTAQSITGLNFSPDLLWFKTRSRAEKHYFYDTVRGAGDRWSNAANESIAEVTGDNSLTSFDSNGFSLGVDGAGIINYQSDSMVAWAWESGSDYGFNIVEYTGANEDGNGNINVSHGLGVVPEFCIVRNLNGNEARVWHVALGNTLATTGYPNPELRLTNAAGSSSPSDAFRGFTDTIARFGANGGTNQAGNQHIAYFWAGVENYSKFGSYTGNGSSDGPFVALPFTPAFVMTKNTVGTQDWQIRDNKRLGYNPVDRTLAPNDSRSENGASSSYEIDLLSNGFKIRGGLAAINGSGNTIVFAAFAEHPFGGDGVSPATAR